MNGCVFAIGWSCPYVLGECDKPLLFKDVKTQLDTECGVPTVASPITISLSRGLGNDAMMYGHGHDETLFG